MKPPRPVEAYSLSTVTFYKYPGVIYFIAAGEPPVAIKIGMAAVTGNRDLRATITRRLSQIQSSNHERIRLLGVIQFTHDTHGPHPTWHADSKERELHSKFDGLRLFARYMRGAEWFKPAPELIECIAQIATKPEALHLPEFFSSAAEGQGDVLR